MGGRTYKQCRERYTNYLKEGLNCGPWTEEEEAVLLEMHSKFGNRWAEIARHLKGTQCFNDFLNSSPYIHVVQTCRIFLFGLPCSQNTLYSIPGVYVR